MQQHGKMVIGRLEKIDFPEWEILNIDAKIDTGAYSSALHCHAIHEQVDTGELRFKILDPSHPAYHEKELCFPEFTKTQVKSSTGKSENRYKVKIRIKIGNKRLLTDFTLTDRSRMKYPVLLGRKVLSERFIVDVRHKYLLKK